MRKGLSCWRCLRRWRRHSWAAARRRRYTAGMIRPSALKSGEKFSIKLDANPTTGYDWNVSVSDEAVLTLEKSEYRHGGSDAEGAGGTQVLVFKAGKAGAATIDLVYQRSWEPREDDEHIQYTVTVE